MPQPYRDIIPAILFYPSINESKLYHKSNYDYSKIATTESSFTKIMTLLSRQSTEEKSKIREIAFVLKMFVEALAASFYKIINYKTRMTTSISSKAFEKNLES